ncbi:MAG TPA: FAD:protein FMN transferase [Terriglobia bacterium]|nr:FAD:protein FMN transferase [Terriglobia bacterium]
MDRLRRIGFVPGQPGTPASYPLAARIAGRFGYPLLTRLVATLSFVLLLFPVVGPPLRAADSLVRYEASHRAMGTVFTVVVYGSNSDYLEEVTNQVFQEIDQLDDQMSNYKPGSELSAINREAARRAVIVEPRLFKLIQDSLQYSRESAGDFDITVGPLMKSWGFFKGQGRLPSKSELAQVLKKIGYQHVKLDASARTIQFDTTGIEIDLGAIAKGYSVDRAVQILRDNGIKVALISSGTSSLYALGSPPGDHGWQISVRNPLDTSKAACVLRLQDLSLAVSGDYEKFFKLGGKTYAHIMDPHTGMPVENMLSTAVVSLSATDSDALSTSFFVEGPDAARHYLDRHPNLTAVFFLPEASSHEFKQVVLKSSTTKLPADAFISLDCH